MTNIRDVLQSIGEAIIQHALFLLETKGKYPLDRNTSKLLKSFRAEVKQGRNSKGQFEGFTPNAQLLLYAADYAFYLDQGRYSVAQKPSIKKVPIAAILEFIKRRRIRGRVRKGKGQGRFISNNQLAYMIQNSIYKNGIRGRHFIQPAFAEGQRLVELYLDNQLLDDMTYDLDRFFRGSDGKELTYTR